MVNEDERRVRKACTDIQLEESMKPHVNQEVFLKETKPSYLTIKSLLQISATYHNCMCGS